MNKDNVKEVRVNLFEKDSLKGFAEATLDCGMIVKSMTIRDGAKGLWVAMPQRTKKVGEKYEYEDSIRFESSEDYFEFRDIILEAYRQKKADAGEPVSEAPTDSEEDYF